MNKRSLSAAALLSALLVGGCGTKNQGLESVHQPVVNRADYSFDLRLAEGGFAEGESQRLDGWLAGLRVGYGDRIAVDDAGLGDPFIRERVAEAVARFGLLLSAEPPASSAPVAPGAVRVVVSRMQASVPGCPDWSRNPAFNYGQHTSSNHGCATNRNLAAMIARPEDLVRGSSGAGVYDPATGFRAIDAYRKAAPTGGGGSTIKSESAGGK